MTSIAVILGLFLVGMLLVALEAFVIPGFGLPGIAGAGIIVFAAMTAWTKHDPMFGIAIGGLALVISLVFLFLVPKTRMGRRLTLKSKITETTGYDEEAKRAGLAVGDCGVTATQLRPSGFANFREDRVEVRTEGEFIDRDRAVVILFFKDGKVFVEAAEGDESSA